MAVLPTNYVDDILDSSETTRRYNMVSNADGTKSFQDATTYRVTGSEFGASDFNATNTQVNANTTALGGISFSYNSTDGHFYATDGTHSKKLGSAEGSATAAQVLSGATFGSSNYDDVATGTMANKGAYLKTLTPSTSDITHTIPEGYHNGSGKITVSKVEVTTPSAGEMLSGKKVTVKSNSTTLKTVTGTMSNYSGQTISSGEVSSDKNNVYVVPSTGYYSDTSKVAIPQTEISNVRYLGTALSHNIKSLFPSSYTSFTEDNFIVQVVSASVSASCTYKVEANNPFSYAQTHTVASSGSITPTVSYNKTTGVLNISGASGNGSTGTYSDINSEGNGSSAKTTSSISLSVKVYIVLGNIENT